MYVTYPNSNQPKTKKNKYVNTLLYISTRFKSNDNNLLQ